MDALTLTQGVWDVRATAGFQTASGTNTGVSVVKAVISTSTRLNDDQLTFTRLPVMNFSFGSTADTSVCVPVSRIHTCTGVSQIMYLNVKSVFTNSLSCVFPSMTAVCKV